MSSEREPPSGDGAVGYNLAYLNAPGVRFMPTDRELIVDYLQPKLRGEPPLYADAVNDDDVDVYSEHPKELVRKLRKGFVGSWYLFSPRSRKYGNGERPRRNTDDGLGFWKSMGAKRTVFGGADGKEVIGHKCALTYHVFVDDDEPGDDGKPKPKPKRPRKPTDWKMVEFISVNTDRRPDKTAANPMLLNDYVLCKITNKKPLEDTEEEGEQGAPLLYGGDASQDQDQQQQSTPSGSPAEPEDEPQQEAPTEEDTGDGDGSLWDGCDPRDLSTGIDNNTRMPSIYEVDYYILTMDDIDGESQPPEEQQATPGAEIKAATEVADTDSVSPDCGPAGPASDYNSEAWGTP